MQYRNLGVAALAGQAIAAYVPSEPWTTLTPSATLSGALTEYTGSFGIAVNPISTTASASATLDAKNVKQHKAAAATQIGDGQIQATTGTSNAIKTKTTTLAAITQIETAAPVTQIGDGQIQATTATETTKTIIANVVTQIGDGQVQATTLTKQVVNPITQIGDGQIQATTATAAALISQIGDGQIQATTKTTTPKETAAPVTQIGDGQIQATTKTTTPKETAAPVTQIGDGQIQATTKTTTPKETAAPTTTPKETAEAATQIGDGQVQATTKTTTPKETAEAATQIGDGQVQQTTKTTESTSTKNTATPATQIGDGQIQQSTASQQGAAASASPQDEEIQYQACATNGTLSMNLHNGILTDSKGRIGSIVANQQFQFDGPPPQAGAIYAAGWSIKDGKLAIGNSTTFYQCLSGNFYNLYAEHIGSKCEPVELDIVELVDC
ncbi:hypothetical protein CAS74_003551 [Pichia kudriavzevii]|uniref:Cell wall mannoprotein PIR1-like C-terminal domain-containing protein n=1 Tax=Pichia kudriavzevii TaxID=4909 RepID=A0A1Z8JLH9_PICKU|nr:hypothetical protein CAS74_003551 [Pichia kudriavzevii]